MVGLDVASANPHDYRNVITENARGNCNFELALKGRISSKRKARGLSQRALAQLAGLDRTYVGSVERGERNVSIDNVERLAEALGIELADLFRRIRP